MAKYTRNSYKRKIIMFGIMLFVSIALISTGFAAWVLSTQQTAEKEGNVTVGIVSNHAFTIVINDVEDKNFRFEPKESDTAGRVKNDGTNFEHMSLTFTGTITNYDFLNTFTVQMTVPQEIINAADEGYIVLPDCAKGAININAADNMKFTRTSGENGGTATFSYEIAFTWGTKFSTMNPGNYYDEDTEGLKASLAEIDTALTAFYNAANATNTKYTIIFTATPK